MNLFTRLFPPRIPEQDIQSIRQLTHETTIDANVVAGKFDALERRAKRDGVDPLALLIKEVKSASTKRKGDPPKH